MKSPVSRVFAEWLMVTVLCAGVAGLMSVQSWLWRIDGVLYDAALSFRTVVADPDIVIVAVDDRSLSEIGRWPWSRAVHAALLQRLHQAGAKVVALDIMFHEPAYDRLSGDAALMTAIAEHGQVVLPVTHAGYASQSDGEGLPVPYFAEAAAALGHIHIELDPDGIARSIYLWEGMNTPHYPQLALAVLQLADPERAKLYPRPPQVRMEGWRRADWMHIPFAGSPGAFRYLSYADVLRGDVPDSVLRDTVVFVGSAAVGMGDMVPTPASGHAAQMPGVEIHATVFNALRKGETIVFASPFIVAAMSVVLILVLMLFMLRSGPRNALLAAFGAMVVPLVVSTLLLVYAGWWAAPATAILCSVLAYPLWSWRRLEAAQHYLDNELNMLRVSSDDFILLPQSVVSVPRSGLDRFSERIAVVRVVAEQQRILQRFVKDTLEGLPVGAAVIDSEGELRFFNRRAAELLDCNAPETMRTMLHDMPWPTAVLGGDSTAFDAGPVQVEAELSNDRIVLASASVLRDDKGRSFGVVVSLSDISDLREAQRGREETMHFLSHDLRAPLASILTLVESSDISEENNVTVRERIDRYARSALSHAENLARLVRAEGVDASYFIELQLDMLVQDAVDEVWALARAKHIVLTTLLDVDDEQGCSIMGDADLLRRAIINLLTNAIKYTPEAGKVAAHLRQNGRFWEVQIQDSGIGISEEQCTQLFKRFARLQTAENRSLSGIGLGLLMVRTVAERHGGSVSVTSTPGEGSVFTLSLPVML